MIVRTAATESAAGRDCIAGGAVACDPVSAPVSRPYDRSRIRVPEPLALTLLGVALVVIALVIRKRRH